MANRDSKARAAYEPAIASGHPEHARHAAELLAAIEAVTPDRSE